MTEAMSEEIAQVVKALKTNFFAPVEFVETAEAATELVLDLIPLEAKVGMGGSTSIRQLDLLPRLRKRGTIILDTDEPRDLRRDERFRRSLYGCDVFLASSNAITLDGKLVNIDGTGNRVAGMIFGPKKVILIVGRNKIVPDVNAAIDRIKNVIAPYRNMSRGRKLPCAVKLRCTDCKAWDRSCRTTVIMEKRPRFTDIAIVLVNEDLGLGWDPAWPEARKEKIASVYLKLVTPAEPVPRSL
ncbi:MAG: lactate utilization protein [Chloroflexota bacterium]